MKKIALGFLVFIASFGISSCDPWEDDSYHEVTPPDEDAEIPGTWKLTAITLQEAYDLNADGTASSDLMAETNCYQNELLTFNQDMTGVATSNSYANITVSGEVFNVECIEETEEMPFAWAQLQNTVTITLDAQMVNATLDGNTLTYVIPEGFVVFDSENGDVTISQDMTFVYTKQ